MSKVTIRLAGKVKYDGQHHETGSQLEVNSDELGWFKRNELVDRVLNEYEKENSQKLANLTVEEIENLVTGCDDLGQLKEWFEEEREGKGRKTVLKAIKEKKLELEGE